MSYHYDAPSLGSSHVLRVKFVTINYITQWNSHRWRFLYHSKIIPYIGKMYQFKYIGEYSTGIKQMYLIYSVNLAKNKNNIWDFKFLNCFQS
jgi:hypothetical protein